MYPPRDSKTFTELVEVISAHPEMELLQKHCIFYYLTKDNSEDGDSAGFAAHFALQPHYRMLIDGYWSMDHGGYEDAIFYFSDPLVEADWPDKILQTLFAAERYKEALYFLQVVRPTLTDPHDFSIHMDLLLANDINDAFEFQRANAQKMPAKDSLLLQLLEYAFNNGTFKQVSILFYYHSFLCRRAICHDLGAVGWFRIRLIRRIGHRSLLFKFN
jgi:hypothetical protein